MKIHMLKGEEILIIHPGSIHDLLITVDEYDDICTTPKQPTIRWIPRK